MAANRVRDCLNVGVIDYLRDPPKGVVPMGHFLAQRLSDHGYAVVPAEVLSCAAAELEALDGRARGLGNRLRAELNQQGFIRDTRG